MKVLHHCFHPQADGKSAGGKSEVASLRSHATLRSYANNNKLYELMDDKEKNVESYTKATFMPD
jgi:hypothetical protein